MDPAGPWALRLTEDRIAGGSGLALPATNRVLYVRDGEVTVTHDGVAVPLGGDHAWHGPGGCAITASARGAMLLRYELVSAGGEPATAWPGVRSRVLLEHPIELDRAQAYLMRCDRVDFAPGTEALPHGHKGGGIRCLIAGALEIRVGDRPGRVMKPGEAWFESGVEPVHAIASAAEPTSFIRVAILPRAIRGQASIVYVNPAHASARPRKYTVFVDEPIQ